VISKAEQKMMTALASKKGRDEHAKFVLEGLRAVEEAAVASWVISLVIHTDDFAAHARGAALLKSLRKRTARIERLTPAEFDRVTDTVQAQGIAAIVDDRQSDPSDVLASAVQGGIIVALDAVADPGNLGGIIRTCDWYGAKGLLLGAGCVDLLNPKVVRSTMGSMFHLPIARNVDLSGILSEASASGFQVLVADSGGEAVGARAYEGPLVAVFGNEARGVSEPVKQMASSVVAIPRMGAAESLNVGVACGIILDRLCAR
jgi:TrmH family RNA methyltransferase